MKRSGTTAGCLLDTFLRQLQHWARLCAVPSRSRGLAGPLSCPCTCVHSAAIHLTSALTSSYPSKYVQRQENTQGKWRFSASGFWTGTSNSRGAQSGDMDSLLSLVKYLSVGLLLEILGFIDCSKGCWLILKAVFDKLRLLGLWSQQTIKSLVDI